MILKFEEQIDGIFINNEVLETDKEVTLFDPKETPELLTTYGDEFKKYYEMYENKTGIRKKKIKAEELFYLISKVRLETGNLYILFSDNVNSNKPFKEPITQSNLCTEIVLPTKPSYLKEQKMVKENFKNYTLKEEIEPGEIALCNLSSINVVEWAELSEERKQRVSYNLLRSHDNLIEYAFYPVKEGEFHNKTYRPIGIGVSNMAYYFAKNKKSPEDLKKLFKAQFDIMEDVYYHLYSSAIKLAKERGKFENFSKTKWSEGWLPIDSDLSIFNKFADESQKLRWENLRKDIKKFGLRFSTIGAVAPTACQTKDSEIVTENGIESIQTILENNKIDFEKLEEIGIPQWLELKNSFKVQTRFGLKEVERIWFNGKVPVREIEFEDGKKYKFSYNHQLLVKFEDGKEKWVQVKDLKENMEIVDLNLK